MTSTSTSSTTNSKNIIHNENASGIFYDIGYNEHGMRLAFQGMSQILDKDVYVCCRRLADDSLVVTIDQKKLKHRSLIYEDWTLNGPCQCIIALVLFANNKMAL